MTLPHPARRGARPWAAVGLAAAMALGACADDAPDATPATTVAPATTTGPATTGPATTTTAAPGALPVAELRTTVEQTMDELLVPGAVVLVAKGDDQWLQAFGTRRFGADEPITTDDSFRIGSVTKTLTATIVLQLVQEGKLKLDDPVSTYSPDVPNGDQITIEQLLNMTSGLQSYTQLLPFNESLDDEPGKVWKPEELVALGLAEPVKFAPGSAYEYSNTNTVLAGLIAEQVAGKDLRTLFQERIFEPLGLTHMVMPAIEDAGLPAPHPQGYMYSTNVETIDSAVLPADQQAAAANGELTPNDVTDLNPSWAGYAGAAISTVGDLATYIKALGSGGLLDATAQAARVASIKPVRPDAPELGYGDGIASFGPLLGHTGTAPGFQTFAGYDPDQDLTVVVLTTLNFSPDGREPASAIAQQLLGILLAAPTPVDEVGEE